MTEAVLDASALIALLRSEPGSDRVAAIANRACVSAVNMAEVLGKMVSYGKQLETVAYQIGRLQLEIRPFDLEQAKYSASLWQATRPAGLSLGDRACLALGLLTGLPVMTADRSWEACRVGVDVILIR